MYAFVDRPVSELSHEGQLLIWAMRSGVVSVGKKACPGTGIGKVFAGRNVIAALQPFLRMMALFNRGGLENFEFCQLACNHVSEHEAIFLQLVSDARSNEALIVRHTLSILVEEEFVGDLIRSNCDAQRSFGPRFGSSVFESLTLPGRGLNAKSGRGLAGLRLQLDPPYLRQ